MGKHTLREYYCAGLEIIGAVRAPARDTGKHLAYYRLDLNRGGRKVYWFVGKSGGLRKGTCASDSHSMQGTQADSELLARGKESLEPTTFPNY